MDLPSRVGQSELFFKIVFPLSGGKNDSPKKHKKSLKNKIWHFSEKNFDKNIPNFKNFQ